MLENVVIVSNRFVFGDRFCGMRFFVLLVLCLFGMFFYGCFVSEVVEIIECEQDSECEIFSCTNMWCEDCKCV